ncbi:conserved protein of unknown function (plasmid) [Rhodovastum atsumiense]|uniref:Uncharacterized protein n=1 Tax=Rhodovastum atsumiense TaxID=504468 RepID=A0A5M6IWP7_9PROT|nr:hypothetical protein [Rhodovastum atsumiense]KAA5611805.1 hypothetical protein F1189_12250 [Rhodovastum atsumiense]CAH2606087.1 conserved protein of unknown function [Rhodovastum atsumiense]
MPNNVLKTIKLTGHFTALSPVSHIGEVVSTTAYLAQDIIVQPDGSVVEVFSYSGNGWRGGLRDIMARRVCAALDCRLPGDAFHLLFSGGRLDMAEKRVDLEAARRIRATVPMLALLGGGVGSEILQGRLRVTNSYPLCREAIPVLPEEDHAEASVIRYGSLTWEKEFSRKDDGKLGWTADWLARDEAPRNTRVADQMRMTSELLAPGAKLRTEIHGAYVSRVELGCLVAALNDFGASPFIGGQNNKGHGLVRLAYALVADGKRHEGFVRVCPHDGVRLSPFAREVMGEYEAHLAASVDAVKEVLGCAA